MEFNYSDEQLAKQQRIRDFCRQEIAPGAPDLDGASAERAQEIIKERVKTLAREGLLGLGLPAEMGGSGEDLLSTVVLHQELGEACPATALSVLSSAGLCARALGLWGEKAEQEEFLKGLLSGEIIGVCGDLEPEAGLDTWTLKTTASPSWFTHWQANVTLRLVMSVISTRAVTVSPKYTGLRNFTSRPRKIVPFPGSWWAMTPLSSEAVNMPWATRLPKTDCEAATSSVCSGLRSPMMPPKV